MALAVPVMAAPLHAVAAGAAVVAGAEVPLAVIPLAEAEGLPNTPLAGPVHVRVLAPRFPETTSAQEEEGLTLYTTSAVVTDHMIVYYQIAPLLTNLHLFQ